VIESYRENRAAADGLASGVLDNSDMLAA